jgi:hypothetical protein
MLVVRMRNRRGLALGFVDPAVLDEHLAEHEADHRFELLVGERGWQRSRGVTHVSMPG